MEGAGYVRGGDYYGIRRFVGGCGCVEISFADPFCIPSFFYFVRLISFGKFSGQLLQFLY